MIGRDTAGFRFSARAGQGCGMRGTRSKALSREKREVDCGGRGRVAASEKNRIKHIAAQRKKLSFRKFLFFRNSKYSFIFLPDSFRLLQ